MIQEKSRFLEETEFTLRNEPKLQKEFCMKNAIKSLAIIALVAVIGFSMIACGDGSDNGGGGGGGGGSGELWAKLTAGSGTWSRDNDSFVMKFTKTAEFSTDGYCELLITIPKAKPDDHDEYDFLEGKVYVKLNGATGNYWCGDLPASKNISFGGGSSDVGIVTFLSDTQMIISGTLSGWAKYYDGSYTRK
jgi:hypothetical protein